MEPFAILIYQIVKIYKFVVIVNVIISWLVGLRIVESPPMSVTFSIKTQGLTMMLSHSLK